MIRRILARVQLEHILSFLGLLGGFTIAVAMILSRIAALETTIISMKDTDKESKEAIIRLSDKIDHNQETLIFYLKQDEPKNTNPLHPNNLVTFMQPDKTTATVN